MSEDARPHTTFVVAGMTCDHCATAVIEELGNVDGIDEVIVDLASGDVTVISTAPLDPDAVRAAIDEAGYELVP